MARHINALSTLQARTIAYAIHVSPVKLYTRDDIEKTALSVVTELETEFPAQFDRKKEHYSFVAFALSTCAKEAIKRGELNILSYLAIIAQVKEENESADTSYNGQSDYGAFGDLLEILVRCAFMKRLSLVTWSALSVKDIKSDDIISKRYGIIEVGHNGKTLSFATLFDYMAGKYTAIVYGMFSDEDKKMVYSLVKSKQYDKAIEYICSYTCYWSNKYDFQSEMDNLTRGKGIALKGQNVQVVYNTGKYNAFQMAIEEGKFITLSDILK